ncbi:baeRF3 domain-containing protein [Sphingobacterium corticibacter]|uniref:Uncharacterized protein n=1 Tax=Sphingobacterium corticibacter TaxID=2171749 RepID=A0A2T8HMT1_9SPHI|nr:hypothetical protein [Sphingobacterium corticibacter]PVH26751.1 hypothetical protein DC487_03865 [Sphingobacterium corticibacter]
MQTIDLELLKDLTSVQDEPCISLYMTTHKVHPDSAADSISFKNLYKKTLLYIQDQKLPKHEALLKPLEKLIADKNFWDNGTHGLAIFASAKETKIIRLPETVQEISCVANAFCIKPLFKMYNENQSYYLLALGLDTVKLYAGDRHHITELDIDGKLPQSMKEALGDQLTDNHFHASVVEGAGLHGYMEKSQEEDIDMDRFFRQIDRVILEHFDIPAKTPLLLAALPEHHTHFARISKNINLGPVHIPVNPHSLSRTEILRKVQEVMDSALAKRKEELLDKQQLAAQENLSSTEITDIVRDAIDGKVDVLCIENGKGIKGSIDLEQRAIDENQTNNTDVINELVRTVFNFGGDVVVLEEADMPTNDGVFTINRY